MPPVGNANLSMASEQLRDVLLHAKLVAVAVNNGSAHTVMVCLGKAEVKARNAIPAQVSIITCRRVCNHCLQTTHGTRQPWAEKQYNKQ